MMKNRKVKDGAVKVGVAFHTKKRGRPPGAIRGELDRLCKSRGVGVSVIAGECRVSQQTVQNWMRGKGRPNVACIAKATGVTLDEVVAAVEVDAGAAAGKD